MNHNQIQPEWHCPGCGVTVQGDFEICWNCGTSNTGQTNLDFIPDNRTITDEQPGAADRKYFRQSIFWAGTVCVLLIIITLILAAETPYTKEMTALCLFLCFAGVISLTFAVILPTFEPKNKHLLGRQEKLRRDLYTNWAVCPHCFTANLPIVHLCHCCTTPLTTHAEIDPLGQIHAAGDTYRKACNRPYKFIIFLGTWILFGPMLLFYVLSLIDLLKILLDTNPVTNAPGPLFPITALYQSEITFSTIFSILTASFLAASYSIILYKVTKNYFRLRKTNFIIGFN